MNDYLNRKIEVYDADANLVETRIRDIEYDEVKKVRKMWLLESDIWVLQDRFNTLTPEQQTELLNFREELRQLPQNYPDSANEAADNFPPVPEWLI